MSFECCDDVPSQCREIVHILELATSTDKLSQQLEVMLGAPIATWLQAVSQLTDHHPEHGLHWFIAGEFFGPLVAEKQDIVYEEQSQVRILLSEYAFI
jgi:hypothetical protein